MPRYEVGVTRHLIVTIEAESDKEAKKLAECFLGNCNDTSQAVDQKEFHFKIHEIVMVENEAFDI